MKKLELYSTPPILMISLKRFKSGRGMYFKDKLEDEVHFPIDHLDISDIVISNKDENGKAKKSIIYELYAISNHYGNMGFGHYTAFAKNPLDNTWYDFDDSHVTEISDPNKVITEAAYNLFYKRKDFSFTDEIDFEAIKNTCDFEDFKLEVSHYAVPEPMKEETQKNDEDMAVLKPDGE
jgi:ubiquitin C-terminal hydrolase